AARAGGSGPRDVLLAPDARTLLDGGRRALARRALERLVEHLVHRLDEAELERAAHVFRDVLEVRLVAARQDHGFHSGTLGRQHLLLDAADRQHLAAERDLSRHGDVRPNRTAGQQRGERGGDGDARRRPVLGNRARGYVDVQVGVLVELGRDAETVGARPDVAERRLRRLLHDVAEAAREREALLPRHARRLDEEDVAAVRRPGEADGYPGILRPLRHLGEEALRPEVLADLLAGAQDGLGPPLGDGARHLPADPPDLSLQVAEPRLARVAADDPRQLLVLEAQAVGREPVLAELLRDQVA